MKQYLVMMKQYLQDLVKMDNKDQQLSQLAQQLSQLAQQLEEKSQQLETNVLDNPVVRAQMAVREQGRNQDNLISSESEDLLDQLITENHIQTLQLQDQLNETEKGCCYFISKSFSNCYNSFFKTNNNPETLEEAYGFSDELEQGDLARSLNQPNLSN